MLLDRSIVQVVIVSGNTLLYNLHYIALDIVMLSYIHSMHLIMLTLVSLWAWSKRFIHEVIWYDKPY